MKKTIIAIFAFILFTSMVDFPDAGEIIKKVDENMTSKSQIIESKMIIWEKETIVKLFQKAMPKEIQSHLRNICLLKERKGLKC